MTTAADVSRADQSSLGPRSRVELWRFVLAGAVVAILDISFAETYWVVIRNATTYARVLQSIASGVLGKSAFQGGSDTVVLGAILHCTVAYGWTAIFLMAARHWRAFGRVLASQHGVVKTGIPFGMVVWLVMDLVVIPLSHAKPTPVGSTWFLVSLLWHPVGVGLPMAVVLRGERIGGTRGARG
jgi:hypothetical protein